MHTLSQGCTCTRAVLRTSRRPGQRAPTADASCDKATPCNVTVLVVMLGATFLLEVYCHARECTEWTFESAIILDSSYGTSLWLLGNRYMKKLARYVLLISLQTVLGTWTEPGPSRFHTVDAWKVPFHYTQATKPVYGTLSTSDNRKFFPAPLSCLCTCRIM